MMLHDVLHLAIGDGPGVSDVQADCGEPDWKITVRLRNETSGDVGFKALTNSPRRWSVRPNGGVVEPNTTLDVVLTALVRSQAAQDRHLILSAPLMPEEAAQLRDLRSKNARTSLDLLSLDNPQVTQVRITPRLLLAAAAVSPSETSPHLSSVPPEEGDAPSTPEVGAAPSTPDA
jgi:hypothetical protein